MISKAGFHKLSGALFLTGAAIGLYFQFSFHKFLNIDTLAYINIAEFYARGDWQHAINGCWSPLYSWILALCHLFSIPLLPACYVLNFIAAAFCLWLSMKIAGRFLQDRLFYFLFSLYALVLMLFYSMSTLTPDLVAMACCLWFILLISDERYMASRKLMMLAGLAAGLMYYAKLYNFVALHLFFIAFIAIQIIKKRSVNIEPVRQILKTYCVFLAVSCIWITILSIHENKLTFSTTGRFTHNLVGPDYARPYPLFNQLYAPPFEGAYSIMINPVNLLDGYNWSPFESIRNFQHQYNIIFKSIRYYYNLLDNYRIKTVLLLAVLLLIFMNRKKRAVAIPYGIEPMLVFFFVYPVFYFPIFIVDRYILICILLFNFFFLYVAYIAAGRLAKKPVIITAMVVVTLSLMPLIIIGKKKLIISSSEYRYYKSFYHQLPKMAFLQGQRIATDAGALLESTQLCYHVKCWHYCTWTDGQYHSLQQYQIRFLLTKKEQASFPFLVLKEKIPADNNTLYIYEVK
jgi:hypothetical protein